MLAALVLPAAPASAHLSGGTNIPAPNTPPGTSSAAPQVDVADCTNGPAGQMRVFASVRSATGVDIANAVARLVFDPTLPALPPGLTSRTTNMSNGDFESQAFDGIPSAGCVPAVNDGHPNDIASTYVPVAVGYSLVITAVGHNPLTIPLDPAVVGASFTPPPGGCFGAANGCLIAIGTVELQPQASQAGRGQVSGAVIAATGQFLDRVVWR
jgi:hypothetical protein